MESTGTRWKTLPLFTWLLTGSPPQRICMHLCCNDITSLRTVYPYKSQFLQVRVKVWNNAIVQILEVNYFYEH